MNKKIQKLEAKLKKEQDKLFKARLDEKEADYLYEALSKEIDKQDKIVQAKERIVENIESILSEIKEDIVDEKDNLKKAKYSLPKKGSFICYKKIYIHKNGCNQHGIAKLKVPSKAKRVTPKDCIKSRVSEAVVESITLVNDYRTKFDQGYSGYDTYFKYRVGEKVLPDHYSGVTDIECTNGIHVYLTRKLAKEHYLPY